MIASLPDPAADLVEIPFTGGFDLALTLHCGQAFGWQPVGGGHAGAVHGRPLFLVQETPCGPLRATRSGAEIARIYLALDHDLPAIHATFPRAPRMREALALGSGLRILRQPVWECLASFIASSQKRVSHIRQIHRRLSERFGTPVGSCHGWVLYDFPAPQNLARLDEQALRACGLGYRAKNLLATARLVAEDRFRLDDLARMETPAARAALMTLPGVGRKIANCVLCFALERLDTVPVDVWVARILRESFTRKKLSLLQLERLAERKLGPFAGYAQQILFHHARVNARPQTPGAKPSRGRRRSSP